MRVDQSPEISARFEVNAHGEPEVISADRLRHYRVVFEVKNPPNDAYAATFELDSNYYDPLRTISPDQEGKFRLETTTYGDYPLVIRLHRPKSSDLVLKESVAKALRRARETMPANPKIDEAVEYVANH